MKMDKTLIRKHFDRHAHEYDDYTVVQRQMVKQLMELLKGQYQKDGTGSGFQGAPAAPERSNAEQPMSILEIGCGTGRLTAELLEAFPHARITVLDLSERMLEETRRKAGRHAARVRFVAGDAEQLLRTTHPVKEEKPAYSQLHEEQSAWKINTLPETENLQKEQDGVTRNGMNTGIIRDESGIRAVIGEESLEHETVKTGSEAGVLEGAYDLIVSSAAFQWFNHPLDTLQSCLKRLAPTGLLAFATFGPATLHELHFSFAAAEEQLGLPYRPHGQAYLSAEDWKRGVMSAACAVGLEWREELSSLSYPTVRTFLRHVQRAGAGNALALPEGKLGAAAEPANTPAAAGSPPLSRKLLKAMEQAYRDNFSGGDQGIRVTYEVFYGLIRV